MKLGIGQSQIQARERKNKKVRKANHKNCRSCGSTNLISTGLDQLCCDCDWHTCFEYVDRGYMNNLHFAHSEHFPKKKQASLKIVELPKGNAPINPDTTTTATPDTSKKKSA